MRSPLKIRTVNGEEIILNEDNICSIRKMNQSGGVVEIVMTNGCVYNTGTFSWEEWDNDRILRKD